MTKRSTQMMAVTAVLLSSSAGLARDTRSGPMVVTKDEKDEFRAVGSLTSVDDDLVKGFAATEWFEIKGAGGKATTNWWFLIQHVVDDWTFKEDGKNVGGAKRCRVGIRGKHINGPHAPDIKNNVLPREVSDSIDIKFGDTKTLTAVGWEEHPAGKVKHVDQYAFRAKVTALEGPPHMVTGPGEVHAKHSEETDKDWCPYGLTVASLGPMDGAYVSYDAATRTLSFTPGTITALNRTGSLAEGFDPGFEADAVLRAQIQIDPVQYIGHNKLGEHRFSSSFFRLEDPMDELHLESFFDVFYVVPLDVPMPLRSGARVSRMTIIDALPESGGSVFLDEFADRNVMGNGVPEEEWKEVIGARLIVLPQVDLIQATRGFTMSVEGIPADYVLTNALVPGLHESEADFNHDGIVDERDLLEYLNCYADKCPDADLNGDGKVDLADWWRFLKAYLSAH